MDAVDPAPGQIRQGGQVRLLHQHLGLEAPHLAGGSCTLRHRATTDDPAHGGISAKPVGIVHVLVPGEPPEDRLAKLSNQRVAAILAGPGVGETLSGEVRQAEGIIEVPKGEQPSKGSSPARGAAQQEEQPSKGSSPASDVTFEPWNSSLRRWSKATRRAAPSASPAAPSISSPALAVYSFVQYTEIGLAPHPATCASGECGLEGDHLGGGSALDGPMTRDWFLAYVEQGLAPTLTPGDVVILDNLPAHKGAVIQTAIEAREARLQVLPPASPEPKDRVSDFHPIETAFAKLKALLRRPPSAPSKASGLRSAASSKPSRQTNAPTTSLQQGTMQRQRSPLQYYS